MHASQLKCVYHRWLKAWGIKLASERQLRKLSKRQIGANLEGEAVPFSFQLRNCIDLRPAPLVFTPNLVDKILEITEQNYRYYTIKLMRDLTIEVVL